MKSREEQLTWAKQRALICVDMGDFACAVAGLRADLAENPLTKGAVSSDQAMRGYKAAMDAALGRGFRLFAGDGKFAFQRDAESTERLQRVSSGVYDQLLDEVTGSWQITGPQ